MDYGKLKTYYESIDGVTVPFVYPQYWDKDKEEWVVVDKDNRLPVDARLTGSNMEYLTYRGINIPSESRVVIDTINVIGYKQYSVGVVTNVQHNYSVDKTPYVGGNVLDSRGRIFMESDYNAVSERQDVLTTDVRIRITNNDNVALRISYFYIFLYK